MKTRACLLLLVVFALVWQSDGLWRRRRRRSTGGCSGSPGLPRYVTWSGCRAPYAPGERCIYRCQPGYTQTSGSTSRTCSNGAWTGSSLVCTRAPRPAPSYRKCISQTRSYVQAIPLYGPALFGAKSSGAVVNGDISCYGHPRSSNTAASAPFFHGKTSLSRRRRGVDTVGQWVVAHRVLLFRGEVFEWGVGASTSSRKGAWEGRRCPSDCAVRWTRSAAGHSTCTREQAEFFTREYKARYGRYRLLWNNCHYFVNRLMKYLDSGCTRMP